MSKFDAQTKQAMKEKLSTMTAARKDKYLTYLEKLIDYAEGRAPEAEVFNFLLSLTKEEQRDFAEITSLIPRKKGIV